MSQENFWGNAQALTERIEAEDASLVEIRLFPRGRDTNPSGDSTQRHPRPRQHQPPAALALMEREVTTARIRRLADAIVAHASGCRGVTSFAMARILFLDQELESRILANVHRFPNLRDVSLEDEITPGGGPEFAYLTLDFVAIHTCWPRTRRMALGQAVSPGLGGRAGGGPLGGPNDVLTSRLGRATNLEEFSAPRLNITQPLRWFRQTRLVETLAGLPRLKTLHLGHLGHTQQPLLDLAAMRALARSVSLETIKLVRFGIDDACADAFCQELQNSDSSATRLRHVEFDDFIPQVSRTGCGSFWNLLRTNASLTHLHIHCTDEDEEESMRLGGGPPLAVLEGDIQAMCRINRAGRRAVQANPLGASNDDWLRLLETASDSASASFWLLQSYPGLVSLGSRAESMEKNAPMRLAPKRAVENAVGDAKRRRLR